MSTRKPRPCLSCTGAEPAGKFSLVNQTTTHPSQICSHCRELGVHRNKAGDVVVTITFRGRGA